MARSQDKGEAFELRVKALLEQHGFQVERDVLIAGNQVDLVARRSAGPAYDYALDALWAIAVEQGSMGAEEQGTSTVPNP